MAVPADSRSVLLAGEMSQPIDYEDVQNRPLWNLFGPPKIGKKQHPSNWTEKTQLKDTDCFLRSMLLFVLYVPLQFAFGAVQLEP